MFVFFGSVNQERREEEFYRTSYSSSYSLSNPKFSNIDYATPLSCKQNNALLVVKKKFESILKKPFQI